MIDDVEEAGGESYPASDTPGSRPATGTVPRRSPALSGAPAWLTAFPVAGTLSPSGEQHLILLEAREFLERPGAAEPVEEDARTNLVTCLEGAHYALGQHRRAMGSRGDLCDLVERDSMWLRPRLERLIQRHHDLETMMRGILAKLDRWPPSGNEEYSGEVVAAEVRIVRALLDDLLMEEYFLEEAMFDPPPALD